MSAQVREACGDAQRLGPALGRNGGEQQGKFRRRHAGLFSLTRRQGKRPGVRALGQAAVFFATTFFAAVFFAPVVFFAAVFASAVFAAGLG